jgi:hypothetical protein
VSGVRTADLARGARPWRAARTLADLGQLVAAWLEGRLDSWPGHAGTGGPDAETGPLVPVLASLNRTGHLVTHASQPGFDGPGYGGRWRQRAAVDAFADNTGLAVLQDAARAAGLLIVVHRADRVGPVPHVVVTCWNGRQHTAFGNHLPEREVHRMWHGCHPDAVRAVAAAHQVAVVDPEWGRDQVLWAALTRAIHR